MFKDKTFKCRVCDSCSKIVGIPALEDFPDEELYEVKNLKTESVDEICDDCLTDRAFTCCVSCLRCSCVISCSSYSNCI